MINADLEFCQEDNNGACICREGFSWNSDEVACLPICHPPYYLDVDVGECLVNCFLVNGTLPTNQTYITGGCLCPAGSVWSELRAVCYPCNLIPDVSLNGTAEPGECLCERPFEWDEEKLVCALDCDEIEGASGHYKHRPYECKCHRGYKWDEFRLQCLKKKGHKDHEHSESEES